ncbi:MAG: T9SS type A sorting domain-containing protein [Bacteroidota bacterium]
MLRFITTLFIGCFAFCLTAQTNIWQGGTGLWTDASGWSLQQVPNSNHDVQIAAGMTVTVPNGFNAGAQSILVFVNATLEVEAGAGLRIANSTSYGLNVAGAAQLDGDVQIASSQSSSIWAILNGGVINTGPSSRIWLDQFPVGILSHGSFTHRGRLYLRRHENGISLNNGGNFRNEPGARVYLRDIEFTGCRAELGTFFRNAGLLEFNSGIDETAIGSFSTFFNVSTGLIRIRSIGSTGINLTNATSTFANWGRIQLYGSQVSGFAGISVNVGARFFNQSSGRVELFQLSGLTDGIKVVSGSRFDNRGRISVSMNAGESDLLVLGNSDFNNIGGDINLAGDVDFALQINDATMTNFDGRIIANNPNGISLAMGGGLLENQSCGLLQFKGNVNVSSAATVSNESGWLEMESQQVILFPTSSFLNEAVVFDQYAALSSSSVVNQGVVIAQQNYAPVPGAIVNNVFELGAGTGISISPAWFSQMGGGATLANYDQVNNRVLFSPGLPSGTNSMFISVFQPGCGDREYKLGFSQSSPRPPIVQPNWGNPHEAGIAWSVYPNPVQQHFTLERPESAIDELQQLELIDLLGRSLARWELSPGNSNIRLERPAGLGAGTYLLRLETAIGEWTQKRLLFID